MRRKDREITDIEKMLKIMNECDCCRLGLVDKDVAYIVPMNFGYEVQQDKITLYFHGAVEGRKIDLLKKNANVTFEMDTKHELVTADKACGYSYLYQSVMGTGKASFVTSANDKADGLTKIMERYTQKSQWNFEPKVLDRTAVIKLEVSEWSCKEH